MAVNLATTTHPPEVNRGILTSWLPVPTSWPSNPECSTAIYSQMGSNGVAIAYDPFYGTFIDPKVACHPTVVSEMWDGTDSPQTVLSLGPFQCNGEYTTAATSKIDEQTTFIACCPSYVVMGQTLMC